MDTPQKSGIHPLVAGASVAVIILSIVGVAAITGYLPGSNANTAPATAVSSPPTSSPMVAEPAEKRHAAPAPRESTHKPQQHAAVTPPHAQAQPAACIDCGVVVDVREVTVKGEASGLGAVAGGVGGVLLGSQIGNGRGKVLAEVAGAAGGAYAGHQAEKYVRSKKRYDVAVQMQDGTSKTVSYDAQPTWRAGDKVKLVNNQLEARS